jgi:hypothetical protein
MSRYFARGAGSWALGLAAVAGLATIVGAQDVGIIGPSLAGSGPVVGTPSVTEAKPESKVWYHDGSWWGSIWSSAALQFRIHRLDAGTDTWIDTGVLVDPRPDSHCDALAAGNKLYIGTHEYSQGGGASGNPMLVTRYSYAGGAYGIDAGFPVQIANHSSESMVIARDSTNTLWAVWKQDGRVRFSHTLADHTQWSVPAILPPNTSDFTSDDICSVIAFGGNQIGVMWSDQTLGNWFFTTHVDGQLDTNWSAPDVLLPGQGNDQINLKTDAAGRVYAVVTTSLDEVKLLVREPNGTWQEHLVATAADSLNRAIVLLDEESRLVHVFAQTGGNIRQKTTSLDAIAFAPGRGTIVIDDFDANVMNATAHKKSVDSRTGLLVLAANVTTAGTYWHHQVDGVPGGFVLAGPTPGEAGALNQFVVTGGVPNAFVVFLVNLQPGAFTIPLPMCPGGLPTNLAPGALRFGLVRADANGSAVLNVGIPPSVSGLFWFSALQIAGCQATPAVEATF